MESPLEMKPAYSIAEGVGSLRDLNCQKQSSTFKDLGLTGIKVNCSCNKLSKKSYLGLYVNYFYLFLIELFDVYVFNISILYFLSI